MLAMNHLTQSAQWQNLQKHQRDIAGVHMRDWFTENANRYQQFSLEAVGMLLDYSKNRITSTTLDLLYQLAEKCQLRNHIASLLAGDIVNLSEKRPALHTALRYGGAQPILINGQDVVPAVRATLASMADIVNKVRNARYLGFSGQPVDTLIHIGIGGSDLGQLMVFHGLEDYVSKKLKYIFFSYEDAEYVTKTLADCNPATTMVIVASKSFSTAETLANAAIAKAWFEKASRQAVALQMLAVTAKPEKAIEFGIAAEKVLPVWDWVGGRYSVWSAMSLIVAAAVGMENFNDFLGGGYAMDQHFGQADLKANFPVILGLLDVWYNNFFGAPTRAIIPYGRKMDLLSNHLQQVYMESLGKRVNQDGQLVDVETGFIIWGGGGSNTQHSFHQLLMQGTRLVPIDFIVPLDNLPLAANCFAQSQVLMMGYENPQPEKVIPGNNPSHTILIPKTTPFALGALLAMYEHRVFVNSVIWGINAFDQWGVERGKLIAQQIFADLSAAHPKTDYDSSTAALMQWTKQHRGGKARG